MPAVPDNLLHACVWKSLPDTWAMMLGILLLYWYPTLWKLFLIDSGSHKSWERFLSGLDKTITQICMKSFQRILIITNGCCFFNILRKADIFTYTKGQDIRVWHKKYHILKYIGVSREGICEAFSTPSINKHGHFLRRSNW